MMCIKHNRWFRVGEKCSFCVEQQRELEREIFKLERENEQIDLTLWKGQKT